MSTGPGRLFGMLQILQKECDRQARKVIEEFKSQRKYDALVGDLTPSFFLLPALVFPKFSWKQVIINIPYLLFLHKPKHVRKMFIQMTGVRSLQDTNQSDLTE